MRTAPLPEQYRCLGVLLARLSGRYTFTITEDVGDTWNGLFEITIHAKNLDLEHNVLAVVEPLLEDPVIGRLLAGAVVAARLANFCDCIADLDAEIWRREASHAIGARLGVKDSERAGCSPSRCSRSYLRRS